MERHVSEADTHQTRTPGRGRGDGPALPETPVVFRVPTQSIGVPAQCPCLMSVSLGHMSLHAGCPGLVSSPRNGFKARRGEKFYLCVVGFRTTHVGTQRVYENMLTILERIRIDTDHIRRA